MQQQQQQQSGIQGAPMGPIPAANVTTEQIQKYLDENKQLILAILDAQNLGKLAECAQYQALLQKNLLYLAAIADAQPVPTVRPQMVPHPGMHPGGQYMPQPGMFPSRAPLQFNPQQAQDQQHHQAQMHPFGGHIAMRPVGVMNGMHGEPSHGGSSEVTPGGQNSVAELPRGSTPSSSVDGRGSKQDASGATPEPSAAADGQRSLATEHGSADAESLAYHKRPEDAKTP